MMEGIGWVCISILWRAVLAGRNKPQSKGSFSYVGCFLKVSHILMILYIAHNPPQKPYLWGRFWLFVRMRRSSFYFTVTVSTADNELTALLIRKHRDKKGRGGTQTFAYEVLFGSPTNCGFSSNWILPYFPTVRSCVRPSQAWHLTFLTYIKA